MGYHFQAWAPISLRYWLFRVSHSFLLFYSFKKLQLSARVLYISLNEKNSLHINRDPLWEVLKRTVVDTASH